MLRDSLVHDLVRVCATIGARVPHWTQGAGGNVSVKLPGDAPVLYVKASGFRLDRVSETAGIAAALLPALVSRLRGVDDEAGYARALAECSLPGSGPGPSLGRLSMEAGFHALLPGRWVIHFHSLASIVMAQVASDRAGPWSRWLSSRREGRLQIVGAEMPGLRLSTAVAAAPAADFYLLTNHGLILQGDTPSVLDRWQSFESAFCAEFDLGLLEDATADIDLSGPLRFYFPDVAVFADRILRIVESRTGDRLAPLADASAVDRDADEIWRATRILDAAYPSLRELPAEISEGITGLPTEQFRRWLSH